MPHNEHPVFDTDLHFTIDPVSRSIKNNSGKIVLIQNDHNSERFTFSIPRHVDRHDMSLCNLVQVHYINVGTTRSNPGIYEVENLQVDADDEELVTCTWLISRNATSINGSLNFLVRFACVNDDSVVEYDWHTAVFSGITISSGIDNSEEVIDEYIDVLEQWKEEVLDELADGYADALEQWKDAVIEELSNSVAYHEIEAGSDLLSIEKDGWYRGDGSTLINSPVHCKFILHVMSVDEERCTHVLYPHPTATTSNLWYMTPPIMTFSFRKGQHEQGQVVENVERAYEWLCQTELSLRGTELWLESSANSSARGMILSRVDLSGLVDSIPAAEEASF